MTAAIEPATIEPAALAPVPLSAAAEAQFKTCLVCVSPAPHRRLWTRAEYERLAEQGIIGPDERLELIEGEIVVKITQNSPHATSIRLILEALRNPFGRGYVISSQLPLNLGSASQPEPDIAVVAGSIRDFTGGHPATAVLVVEVSDTTLASDRTLKAGLYAQAGIEEYWILNLADRTLEVHRQPAPMSERPLGHYYRSVVQYTSEESVSPLAAPDYAVAVADLLP